MSVLDGLDLRSRLRMAVLAMHYVLDASDV